MNNFPLDHTQHFLGLWLRVLLIALGLHSRVHGEAVADVCVGYSATWRASMGGTDQTNAAIYNQFAGANGVAWASGSPHRMSVVGTMESAHDPTNEVDCGAMIGWMANYDGRIADVRGYADYLGADLVAYVGDMYNNGAAAQAQQPGRYSCYEQQWFSAHIVAHETGGHNFHLDHRDGAENPKTIMLHNYCGGGSQGYFSNPNIWLNGARLLGTGSCLGATAGAGGDNAYRLSTAAQERADAHERRVWGSWLGAPKHRWQFLQPAAAATSGTTITDSVSGAIATVRGQGATFTGSGLRLPGGTSGNQSLTKIAAYLDLPNGLFSAMPNFTIEIWATPHSAQNWMRVIEIGRTVEAGDGLGATGEYTGITGSPAPGATSASDVIGLSACMGTGSLNVQRFLAGVDGNILTSDANLITNAGQKYHYALTFADAPSGATVKWFRNGILIKTLNVGFHSASLEDVNIWLGRSLWSNDPMADIEYHDIRIQSAAIADGEVAGNYRIGSNNEKVTLWANDGYTQSGFANGAWEGQSTPSAPFDYEVGTLMLRSPFTGNQTFPGRSLSITGGNLHLNGNTSKTTTIHDLRLQGATIGSFAEGGATQTLAGTITIQDGTISHMRGAWGPLVIASTINGASSSGSWAGMLYTENAVTLTANNSNYRGATIIGDGRFSTLRISNENNLGSNPHFYGGAWLELNRGILETTASLTIDDPNRGVRIGPSGGFLRPNPGTTLTIRNPITSPAAGNTLQTAPMDSNPIAGIFFKDGAGTLVLTSPNNSHNGEMQLLDGILRIDEAGRMNNGDHWMPITLQSTLHFNSSANQILRGAISGNGILTKSGSGTLSINGANSFTGAVHVNAGVLMTNPGNAATNRAFSFVSNINVSTGATLRSGTNGLFGWDGSQARPITIHRGGLMTTDASNTDVNIGSITLNGGTLAGYASPSWGSWNLKRVTNARLLVTENSTVSAPNVGIGANNSIDVAAGKTLTFTGTITDLTSEGVCALVKSNGTGTLHIQSDQTYTGATTLLAGTTLVNGSLGNTHVTVAEAATLGGTGNIAGATIIHGIHQPGYSVGSQSFGSSLQYSASSHLQWDLTANSIAPGNFDRVNASGTATITAGAKIDVIFNAAGSGVDLQHSFWRQPRSWTILSAPSINGNWTLGTVSNDRLGRAISAYGTLTLQQNSTATLLIFTPYTASEQWRLTNFGSIANAGSAADFNDPDFDGLHNLLEYALGTDPHSNKSSEAPQATTVTGKLRLQFTRNTAANDIVIQVMASDTMAAPWTELARSTNGAAFSIVAPGAAVQETGIEILRDVKATDIYFIDDPSQTKRFMRLEVSR